jgi:hypothetical protein
LPSQADLQWVLPIGIHPVEGSVSVEEHVVAACDWVVVADGVVGQLRLVVAIGVHDPDLVVGAIAFSVEDLGSVW